MFWRVLIVLMLLPSLAFGQDVASIPPGPDKIEPLKLGEPAPYPGMLYDYDTALRWGNWLKQYQLRLELDVKAEQDKCEVKINALQKELDLREKANTVLQKDLQQRVLRLEKRNLELAEELRNPSWYNTRTFGIIVGVVGTATVAILSVYAVDKVR